jgi:hypothetical protein
MRPFLAPKCRWENESNMNVKGVGSEDAKCICLAWSEVMGCCGHGNELGLS